MWLKEVKKKRAMVSKSKDVGGLGALGFRIKKKL